MCYINTTGLVITINESQIGSAPPFSPPQWPQCLHMCRVNCKYCLSTAGCFMDYKSQSDLCCYLLISSGGNQRSTCTMEGVWKIDKIFDLFKWMVEYQQNGL